MKRRELKKSINNLCGELFAECIALNYYENVDKDRVASVMESILMMQADIVSRIISMLSITLATRSLSTFS